MDVIEGGEQSMSDSSSDIGEAEEAEEEEEGAVAGGAFTVGDVVWGQSHGCASWPGKLVSEAEVGRCHAREPATHANGKVWVRWFGDHSFAQVEPDQLKSLSDGLEAHHRAWKEQRRARRMDTNLQLAIQEAMSELDRQQTPNDKLDPNDNVKVSGRVS
ncbi:PREDICTED: methyl-CpG-binding domain protein 5-like [Priapulus caudatus]|uniref:Methyl-CpG-binding domain protein 5-like n=1 Tax=Priapulus caudatus TaxID=37621 RepID=A0ABM1ELP2_PRICU|nr:PREDICTED: methyl-CpG-binding domain protein 5-like [Priapulus caudatus]